MYKYILSIILPFLLFAVACVNANDSEKNKDLRLLKEGVIQALLDKSDLTKYFHADLLPERSPLVIVENNIIKNDLDLNKFGRPVVFMEKNMAKKHNKPYLEISSLSIENGESTIQFTYPIEGISGITEFNIVNGEWELKEQEIIER